ncbi:hypothetical protein A9G48_02920 [Gilliamella sp. wkB18]|uniref:hypothetical protein n=1 Tax=Gilliamella sp. wkB18 TaxID=3120260 RepID=UPI0004DD2841|nr:hypothetical protein [Gilliamella apicola]KFA58958.1 hypothetical protein GAPWKB11_0847 [Gilliamella apicola]OCG64412.1 hypothetical protein A9G48_02920 [Gilliamella apicola]
MSNSQNFLSSINAFVDKAKAKNELVVKKACIEILQDIIRMSPVGNPELWAINQTAVAYNIAVSDYNSSLRDNPDNLTKNGRLKKGLKVNDSMDIKKRANYSGGRFRGNWQVTFNVPASVELDRIDPSGMDTLKDGIEQIGRYTNGVQSIYFTNNLPYSVRLEFGHSKQAPNGIVRVAALNAQVHFENAAKGG